MESIKTAAQHAAALARAEALIALNPSAESAEGRELGALAAVIETWELAAEVIRDLAPAGIESSCDECGGDADLCRAIHPGCVYPRVRAMLAPNDADSRAPSGASAGVQS